STRANTPMSSALTPTPPAPVPPPNGTPAARREITLISHSMLFYWWPIWLLGYMFALITYFEDHRLAILPPDSTVIGDTGRSEQDTTALTLIVKNPLTKSLDQAVHATSTPGEGATFKTRVSQKAWLGPIFCVVLLLTVVITNVPLRGLWSFLVLLLLFIIALL